MNRKTTDDYYQMIKNSEHPYASFTGITFSIVNNNEDDNKKVEMLKELTKAMDMFEKSLY